MSADCLPDDVWLCILSNLDHKDLVSCSSVNKTLYDLSADNSLWMKLCGKYWLQHSCLEGLSWKEHFRNWYRDFGPYIQCYCKIKSAWNHLTDFLKTNCPTILQSIKSGVSEAELDALEIKLEHKLPLDLRCSYRIHNGQKLISHGLMGNVYMPLHFRSAALLDIDTALGGVQHGKLKGNMPLTFCIDSKFCEFISLCDQNGLRPSNIFLQVQDNFGHHAFISGENFTTWFTNYVTSLVMGSYSLKDDYILRFYHEPECVAKTGGIEVSVSTCFVPELSTIRPPCFVHAYQITMQMDENAPKSESCRLESRHWMIVDEDGEVETVDGSGVVGEYPEMRPGATFTWISCTTLPTTYGHMTGHFTMRNFATGEEIDINCPIFHMKCHPYVTLYSHSD